MAVEAKQEAHESKVKLKNELDDRVVSLEKGNELNHETKTLVDTTLDSVGKLDAANQKLVLESISKKVPVAAFKSKLEDRIKEIDKKLDTKKEQGDMIKSN